MKTVSLTPGKRVLFLTKDPDLIRKQLRGELNLRMQDLRPEDLLDDINTDTMTPAWVCFEHRPEWIAKNAYAGMIVNGERVFPENALKKGNFEVIVSGLRKGVGSSRETAAQAEKYSGIQIAIAASFAPIHARNNINLGVLMGGYEILNRLQKGEEISLEEFTRDYDPVTQLIVEYGGLFPFSKALSEGRVQIPKTRTGKRPMTMAEKILASHLLQNKKEDAYVKPGDPVLVRVDGGYSHDFTSAQVHAFLAEEYGEDYEVKNPKKFAAFEDHLIYAEHLPQMAKHSEKINTLRKLQVDFIEHTGVLDFSARNGVSPGICHQVAREKIIEPGEFIQATDSHTCMGGGSNALAWGLGTTEYANLLHSGFTMVTVPESIRFELVGKLVPGVTAKDVILYILLHYAKPQKTLNRVMEYGGPGLATLSVDERATLANMATECSARSGIVEADEELLKWIAQRHQGVSVESLRAKTVKADPDAEYAGGVHTIDLSKIKPMVATPGDPAKGIPSDPTNGALVEEIGSVPIDIAYAGSCTAGKEADLDFYAKVVKEAVAAGKKVAPTVSFFLQFGSKDVEDYSRSRGYLELFEKAGVRMIAPGCGACIGCGPGVSEQEDQVTVSAINRNFKGRSGPGKLYLASPLTVAASAFTGRITPYREGMFTGKESMEEKK